MMWQDREFDEFVRHYYAAKARLWIIRVMTAAALFVILCVLVGGVR